MTLKSFPVPTHQLRGLKVGDTGRFSVPIATPEECFGFTVLKNHQGEVVDILGHDEYERYENEDGEILRRIEPDFQEGETVWVQEEWLLCPDGYIYRSHHFGDTLKNGITGKTFDESAEWEPVEEMPVEAARIFLQITSVKPQRLFDVTNEEAIAEGLELIRGKIDDSPVFRNYRYPAGHPDDDGYGFPFNSFRSRFEAQHGEELAQQNPWLFAFEYTVLSTTGKPENL